jgi:DNA-binding MarR family transcriptional regulator
LISSLIISILTISRRIIATVSPERAAVPPSKAQGPGDTSPRLGYLLKVAQLRFSESVRAALAPLGIDTREWAALISLDDQRPLSQAEIAQRAGIDRTTMVALIDELQAKGLIERRPHRDDRRKNVVEITAKGRDLRRRAARQVDDAERRFLSALGEPAGQQLKNALNALIAP